MKFMLLLLLVELCGCASTRTSLQGFSRACDMNQLQVRLLAVDHPGMGKSISVYALINVSSQRCRIFNQPQVFAEMGKCDKKRIRRQPVKSTSRSFVLLPQGQRQWVQDTAIVWFAVKANMAIYPGDAHCIKPCQSIALVLAGSHATGDLNQDNKTLLCG